MANEQQPGKPLTAHGAARRRFTRAGAAASGVLLTLHSQPGMAATVCATPSGFLSGQLSARNPDPGACVGRTPGFWKSPQSTGLGKNGNGNGWKSWPAPATPGTLFRSVFACSGAMSSTYGADSCTLLYMLETTDTWDKYNLGSHLVAAYLNVLAGYSGFQTVAMLNTIWNELRDYGYYTPTAGVKWNASQVVDYLKATMPV